jgi:hypothetical protein
MLPHAVKDGIAGLLLEEIQGAFQVAGLQQFNLSKQAAAEFLEVSLDCRSSSAVAPSHCRMRQTHARLGTAYEPTLHNSGEGLQVLRLALC